MLRITFAVCCVLALQCITESAMAQQLLRLECPRAPGQNVYKDIVTVDFAARTMSVDTYSPQTGLSVGHGNMSAAINEARISATKAANNNFANYVLDRTTGVLYSEWGYGSRIVNNSQSLLCRQVPVSRRF